MAESSRKTQPRARKPLFERHKEISDVSGLDRFYLHSQVVLEKRLESWSRKCEFCWFTKDRCVCHHLLPLHLSKHVQLLIYIHYMEYGNSGDDAKLLLRAAPEHTKFLIFGNREHDELMCSLINNGNSVLLYPDEGAYTIDQFHVYPSTAAKLAKGESQQINHNQPELIICDLTQAQEEPVLNVIVLDGTWNQVRAMKKHFDRIVQKNVPHLKLQPESLQYWTDRGSESGYGRTQSQPDRICTVEAIALLLREFGELPATCNTLMDYVRFNNLPWKS
jgi:DTW domain-containing protein YfiP